MTTYEETIQLTGKLSLVEKVRLLEHLSASLKHDIEIEAYKHIPWEQFIDLTYLDFIQLQVCKVFKDFNSPQ